MPKNKSYLATNRYLSPENRLHNTMNTLLRHVKSKGQEQGNIYTSADLFITQTPNRINPYAD